MLVGLAGGEARASAPVNHRGDQLVEVQGAWPDALFEMGLDVWTHRTGEPRALVRVTPRDRAMLDASGLSYRVLERDLGAQVEAERLRLTKATRPTFGGGLDPTWYDDYRDLDAVLGRLAAMVAAYPMRASLVEIGMSLEGRPIRGIHIATPDGDPDRPIVVVQGCQHAREWITVASTVYVAEEFLTAGSGTVLDNLMTQAELVVVPVVNPDGYVYSWDVDRFWRKNRRDGHGVDLNRNWSLMWGGLGSSGDINAGDYRGAGPFSEPESTAMRDYLISDPDIIAHFDVHSFGQLLLYPWGFDYLDAPDEDVFVGITDSMANEMWPPYEQWYTPLQSSDLYPASGNSMDWGYGALGLYAVAAELRPDTFEEGGFVLPPNEIIPTGEELVIATRELIEASIELGPGEPGDSGGSLEGTGGESTSGSTGGEGTATTGGEPSGSSTGELDGTGGSGGGSEGPPPPASTSGTPPVDPSTDGGASTGEEPDQDGDDAGGCGCRSSGSGSGAAWWLLSGLWLVRRRR